MIKIHYKFKLDIIFYCLKKIKILMQNFISYNNCI